MANAILNTISIGVLAMAADYIDRTVAHDFNAWALLHIPF